MCQRSTMTLSSPRRLLTTSPSTATWSPRSTSAFHSASRLLAHPRQREHRLQLGAVPLAQRREAELAGVPQEDDPTRDRDLHPGGGTGVEVRELLADLAQGVRPRNPDRVGRLAGLEQPGPLLTSDPKLLGQVAARGGSRSALVGTSVPASVMRVRLPTRLACPACRYHPCEPCCSTCTAPSSTRGAPATGWHWPPRRRIGPRRGPPCGHRRGPAHVVPRPDLGARARARPRQRARPVPAPPP